jgi:hypothetical protein
MNFVIKKINQDLEVARIVKNEKHEIGQLLRVKIEFYLLLILGYLWNKNFNNLSDEEARQFIINKIVRPSLGDLIDIARRLDLSNEIFSDKKIGFSIFQLHKIEK